MMVACAVMTTGHRTRRPSTTTLEASQGKRVLGGPSQRNHSGLFRSEHLLRRHGDLQVSCTNKRKTLKAKTP